MLGAIPEQYGKTSFYKGSQEINEKKLLRNVLQEGDKFFNFGDLLSFDKDYFVYFRDRVGDTFRYMLEVFVCEIDLMLFFITDQVIPWRQIT